MKWSSDFCDDSILLLLPIVSATATACTLVRRTRHHIRLAQAIDQVLAQLFAVLQGPMLLQHLRQIGRAAIGDDAVVSRIHGSNWTRFSLLRTCKDVRRRPCGDVCLNMLQRPSRAAKKPETND